MAINGYILVKDKDGKMKYFKDGKYYSPDEVRIATKAQTPQAQTVERKQELKPIYSFNSVKKSSSPPIPVVPATKIKPTAPPLETKPPAASAENIRIDLGDVDELGLFDLKKTLSAPISPRPPASRPAERKVVPPIIREKVKFEIEELAPHEESRLKRESDQKFIEEMVNNVIQRLKIKFSDVVIENRFRGVMVTYFRGVRHAKEVGYLLGLPKMSGGLELPKDKIAIILTVLEQAAHDFHKARRDVAAKPFDVARLKKAEDVEHQLSAPVPVKVEPKSEPEKILAAKPNVPVTVTKAPTPNSVARPAYASKPVSAGRSEVIRPLATEQAAMIGRQAKPQIRDVKADRRLVGPVEELEILDLVNLRQLGKTAEDMQAQLKKKFDFLSEQALVKKVEGVQAWKKSPVFRLYIAMTYEGLRERKPIAEVIRARQIANTECLTLSEYEMIGRLSAEIAL